MWRGVREAEWARLESAYTDKIGIAGSTPALSASLLKLAVLDGELAVPCNLQPAIAGSIAF